MAKRMNVSKTNLKHGKTGTVVRASWITDELIGIRILEQRLSKKLKATSATENWVLLDGIRQLNTRVELLDRALDEFQRMGRAA
jgi:hypothetical protein